MSSSVAAHSSGAYVVNWSVLSRWDIKSARAASFRAAFPHFVPLGEFIEEATEIIRPWEKPDHQWPVYGVNNKTGVELSHHQPGREFNAPYKRIEADWFFHNPTRANVGSLGRVPAVPEDALTSPEYQVWRINRDLLPDFVEILIQLPVFLELVECHRVGAVKERLFVQNLMEIPIPPLTAVEQQAIIAHWQAAQDRNVAALKTADAHEANTQTEFLRSLGLHAATNSAAKRAFALRWTELERWGVDGLRKAAESINLAEGRYPVSALGELVALIQYGTSDKANIEGRGTPVLRMNNVHEGVLRLHPLKHIELPANERESLLLKDGDILFNRTNSKELVGKCGVFHEQGEYVFASYLIRVRTKPDVADPDYVAFVINGPVGRQQIDSMSRQIIGQANVNSRELRSLRIPLPPLPIQKQLVAEVTAAREKIAAERAAAAQLAADTAREVEEMILGQRPVPALALSPHCPEPPLTSPHGHQSQ